MRCLKWQKIEIRKQSISSLKAQCWVNVLSYISSLNITWDKLNILLMSAVNSTAWSRRRPESCLTSASGWGKVAGCAVSSPSTWRTPPRPSRSCCGPTTSTSTWVRASGSNWLRAVLWHSESAPRSAAVSPPPICAVSTEDSYFSSDFCYFVIKIISLFKIRMLSLNVQFSIYFLIFWINENSFCPNF